MTDCRRSTFTHHILPHKWTKPLPSQEGPSALCSANHLQVEPRVRLTPAAGSTSMCTRWQLTWRCHFVDVTYHLYVLNTVPDLSLRPLWSIQLSNRMYLKKEKWSDWWDTDCQEFSCGFLCPPRSCLWHWFPSSLVLTFQSFLESENTFSTLYSVCDSTELPTCLRHTFLHGQEMQSPSITGTFKMALSNIMWPSRHLSTHYQELSGHQESSVSTTGAYPTVATK